MAEKTCLSCKTRVVNDRGHASFKCPKCADFEIVRCGHCRTNATPYICPACRFTGPN